MSAGIAPDPVQCWGQGRIENLSNSSKSVWYAIVKSSQKKVESTNNSLINSDPNYLFAILTDDSTDHATVWLCASVNYSLYPSWSSCSHSTAYNQLASFYIWFMLHPCSQVCVYCSFFPVYCLYFTLVHCWEVYYQFLQFTLKAWRYAYASNASPRLH